MDFFKIELFAIASVDFKIYHILFFAVFIIIGLILNRVLNKFFFKLERNNSLNSKYSKTLSFYLKLTIWLILILILLGLFGLEVGNFLKFEIFSLKNIVVTPYQLILIIFLVLFTRLAIIAIKIVINHRIDQQRMEKGVGQSIFQLIRYLLWIISISLVLEIIGLKVTILIAGSAALMVGIGLGLQKIFKDFLSGVLLLIERNLKVGDIVEVEKVVGKVSEIGLRTSMVITRDNIKIIVPNSSFIEANVINWSHNEPIKRFFVQLSVSYNSDISLVKKLLLECADNNPRVAKEPIPKVFFFDFGDSGLFFKLLFWTTESFSNEEIKSELRFEIFELFRRNNVVIPYQQMDVHIN